MFKKSKFNWENIKKQYPSVGEEHWAKLIESYGDFPSKESFMAMVSANPNVAGLNRDHPRREIVLSIISECSRVESAVASNRHNLLVAITTLGTALAAITLLIA